jgi:hypothetical protein
VDKANIVTGLRRRALKRDKAFAYTNTVIVSELPTFLYAFAAGLYAEKPTRRYRDDLPEPLKHFKDIINYPF